MLPDYLKAEIIHHRFKMYRQNHLYSLRYEPSQVHVDTTVLFYKSNEMRSHAKRFSETRSNDRAKTGRLDNRK